MSPEARKRKQKEPQEEAVTPDDVRLDPEEREDPAGRKVIEYHKNGACGTEARDESDLDAFVEQWNAKIGSRIASEYHKPGAPYAEPQSVQEGHEPSIEVAHKVTDSRRSQSSTKQPLLERVLDISTVEVMAFTIFRAMFGKGIRVPLKIEGSMDMEIAVKDTDVVINTNDVTFQPPKLQVWHFIFTYKGKPVMEYGRGIDGVKIHFYRAFVMLVARWWGGRKKKKANREADEAKDRELTTYAVGSERLNE